MMMSTNWTSTLHFSKLFETKVTSITVLESAPEHPRGRKASPSQGRSSFPLMSHIDVPSTKRKRWTVLSQHALGEQLLRSVPVWQSNWNWTGGREGSTWWQRNECKSPSRFHLNLNYGISIVNSQRQTLYVPVYKQCGTAWHCPCHWPRRPSNHLLFTKKYYMWPRLWGSLFRKGAASLSVALPLVSLWAFLCEQAFPFPLLAAASHRHTPRRPSPGSLQGPTPQRCSLPFTSTCDGWTAQAILSSPACFLIAPTSHPRGDGHQCLFSSYRGLGALPRALLPLMFF